MRLCESSQKLREGAVSHMEQRFVDARGQCHAKGIAIESSIFDDNPAARTTDGKFNHARQIREGFGHLLHSPRI